MRMIFRSIPKEIAILAASIAVILPNTALATSYGQSAYYGQGSYYGQGGYYSQGGYYGQGYYQGYYQSGYYSQANYYAQGSYETTITTDVTEAGNLGVTNSISKASGTFVIDDPLDPANKLLFHSFVESPEAKNIYDGIITLDKNGAAIVHLPSYFDALNGSVRYQLKPIGASMPNLYVSQEEHDNQFAIGGGVAGGKVSWQVTGVRHDAYILANPIVPVVDKGPGQLVDKGQFLCQECYAKHPFPLDFLIAFLKSHL